MRDGTEEQKIVSTYINYKRLNVNSPGTDYLQNVYDYLDARRCLDNAIGGKELRAFHMLYGEPDVGNDEAWNAMQNQLYSLFMECRYGPENHNVKLPESI